MLLINNEARKKIENDFAEGALSHQGPRSFKLKHVYI